MNRTYGIVAGQSGMGKSYMMINYIIPALAKNKPVIVLDILGEYENGIIYDGFESFISRVREEKMIGKCVHIIRWQKNEDAINTIRFIRFLEKSVSFVVEEAHVLFTDSALKKVVKNSLKKITMFGRHHGIDVILCTQRPVNLSADVRSQAQFTVFFRLKDRADLTYARQIDPELADTIASLQKRQYITEGQPPSDFSKLKINKINTL